MLNDEDAINDVNPFVEHDFFPPGGVRQTDNFSNFSEIKTEPLIYKEERSPFCDYSLCEERTSDCYLSRPLHPRRNIDTGFTQDSKMKTPSIGVSNKQELYIVQLSFCVIVIFILAYLLRR